jgi:hypothetical protein
MSTGPDSPDTPGPPSSAADPRPAVDARPDGDDRRHVAAHAGRPSGLVRLLGLVVLIGGALLAIAGVVTWVVVTNQLSDEQITVSDDADRFAGDDVDGPFTAYEQARVINRHALAETGGLTYAQLEQDDPRRDTVMTASFLRASLFTSVVSFGVAAFAFGLGLLMILVGLALLQLERRLRTAP